MYNIIYETKKKAKKINVWLPKGEGREEG